VITKFKEGVKQSSVITRTKMNLLGAIPSTVESLSDEEVRVLASTLHNMPELLVLRSSSSAASATNETPAMAALSHFLYAADATTPPGRNHQLSTLMQQSFNHRELYIII
jgi:hypothetical protein